MWQRSGHLSKFGGYLDSVVLVTSEVQALIDPGHGTWQRGDRLSKFVGLPWATVYGHRTLTSFCLI